MDKQEANYTETLKNMTVDELIEEMEYFGCDPYYRDLWEETLAEIKHRMREQYKENEE